MTKFRIDQISCLNFTLYLDFTLHLVLTINIVKSRFDCILNTPQLDLNSSSNPGVKETEVNEFMMLGLGLGISSVVMIALFVFCHRKRRRRRDSNGLMRGSSSGGGGGGGMSSGMGVGGGSSGLMPGHPHFHTCESIGERFANSSSMDSVSKMRQELISCAL